MPRGINESYRKAALVFTHGINEHRYDSVLFSAAQTGEGVTSAVLGIARELAGGHGLKPLVVEMDARRPQLARRLRLDTDKTMQAVAAGKMPLEEAVQKDHAGVHVLVAGSAAAPGGQWVAADLRRVLEQARAALYDIVLVDTAPILEQPDILAAGAVVPRVVLVVEAGRTTDEMLDRVRTRLQAENISIIATILNKERKYMPRWLYRWISGSRES